MERSYRSRSLESSPPLTAQIQPRSWGEPQLDQPQPSGIDFSHVDLFSHAPQRGPVQTKLTVGAPNDVYEQEADRVAQEVMSTPDTAAQPAIQRQGGEEEELQAKPIASTITPLVQRESMPEEEELQAKPIGQTIQRESMPEEEELQMKPLGQTIQRESMPEEEELQMKPSLQRSSDGSFAAGNSIESQLSTSKGGGSPLPTEVRDFMEPRFGTDFSQVRVHTGGEAVQMNQDLSAQAFTHGNDVYFGAGKSAANDDLTAHELTHVVQQTGSRPAPEH
jgi:Domain of unknown function (DUF4157)